MGFTGFAVVEDVERDVSVILGLAFVVGGLAVFMAKKPSVEERKNKDGNLIKIIRSVEFKRNTRRVPKKMIENAIDKIGTGLADVHPLKGTYSGQKAIDVTKGGRIIYQEDKGFYVLKGYLPSHNY